MTTVLPVQGAPASAAESAPDPLGRLVLAGLLVLAAWLRVPLLQRAVSPAELQRVGPEAWGAALWEAAVSGGSPPYTALVRAVGLSGDVVAAGRSLSLLCGLLAVVAAVSFARQVGRSTLIGSLVAGLLVAIDPIAVRTSAMVDPAALLLVVGLWHAGAALRVGRAGATGRARIELMLSAVILGQLHPMALFVLVGEALAWATTPSSRPLALRVLPAAVLALPWVLMTPWRPGVVAPLDALVEVASLGLWSGALLPATAWAALGVALFGTADLRPPLVARGLVGALGGLLTGVFLQALGAVVRLDAAVLLLAVGAPLVALRLGVVAERWRVPGALVGVALLLVGARGQLMAWSSADPHVGVDALAQRWPSLATGGVVYVAPADAVALVTWRLAGRLPDDLPSDGACTDVAGGCVVVADHAVVPLPTDPALAVDGLVANLSSVTWPAQPGCREVLVAVGLQVLDCAAR